jgi:hypothetical protein
MQLAKVVFAEHSLPTLGMFAVLLTVFLMRRRFLVIRGSRGLRRRTWESTTKARIILAEVKTFSWVNFTAHSHLKILVRDFAVAIKVKLVEQSLELSLGDAAEAPVLKIEPELFGFDWARFLHIQIHKSLSQGLPLKFNLL